MMPALQVIDLIATDNSPRFAPAGYMASAIIEITQQRGNCQPQDLNAKGFSRDEIRSHWHMAQSLADIEIRLMGATAKSRRP